MARSQTVYQMTRRRVHRPCIGCNIEINTFTIDYRRGVEKKRKRNTTIAEPIKKLSEGLPYKYRNYKKD